MSLTRPPCARGGAGLGRARLHRRRTRSALSRGHHLHPNLGGNSVPRRRAVCLQPPRGRLVHGQPPAHAVVLDALDIALRQRQPDGVIHHSDQGSQYTLIAFGKRCHDAGVRPSTGSAGDCYDNAMCESFFATPECELLESRRFRYLAEARMAVFEFIEGWCNPRRRRSAIGYLSHVNYERSQRPPACTNP